MDAAPVRIQPCTSIDVAGCFTTPPNELTPSHHATCICFHPSLPILAVAAQNCVAVYDLITGCRLGRSELISNIIEMTFSPDKFVLALVLENSMILGMHLSSWQAFVLVPKRNNMMDKPLMFCLLAVTGGQYPSVVYCKHGKETFRYAALTTTDVLDSKGRPARMKDGSWGSKVKLEPARPIYSMTACGGTDSGLVVVHHADGALRSYALTWQAEQLNPTWQIQIHDAVSKPPPSMFRLLSVPHPNSPGASLLVLVNKLNNVCVLQLSGGSTTPAVLLKTKPGLPDVLGAGVLQETKQLIVFGQYERGGRIRAVAFNLTDAADSQGAVKVEPLDLASIMDFRQVNQHEALQAPLAPAPTVSNMAPYAYAAGGGMGGGYAAARTDGMLGYAAPSDGKTQAAAEGAAKAGNATGALLQSMWSPTPAWSHAAGHGNVLLNRQGPCPAMILVHPSYPLLAALMAPSSSMALNDWAMNHMLIGSGVEEYNMVRRLLTVPILCATSWESLTAAGAGRAVVQPLHTSLHNWTITTTVKTLEPPPPSPKAGAEDSKSSKSSKTKKDKDKEKDKKKEPAPPPVKITVPHVTLPANMFFVSDNAVLKYSLVSKAVTTIKTLLEGRRTVTSKKVRSVSYSKAGAWLIFFEDLAVAGDARWCWTLVHASSMDAPLWTKPGRYGCFIGPDESHLAVVDATGRLGAVFSVKGCDNATANQLYLYSLEGLPVMLSQSGSLPLPIFPGPPRDPVYDASANAVVGCVMWQSSAGGLAARPLPAVLDVPQEQHGSGTARSTPRTSRPSATPYYALDMVYNGNNSSSDDDDSSVIEDDKDKKKKDEEIKGTGAVPPGCELGSLGPKYWLPLLPGEIVIQVAWQSLDLDFEAKSKKKEDAPAPTGLTGVLAAAAAAAAASGSIRKIDDDDASSTASQAADDKSSAVDFTSHAATADKAAGAAGKSNPIEDRKKVGPTMGAVLTNQRIMLVSESLNLHASVQLSTLLQSSFACPVKSLLWVGPALLFHVEDGRIMQLAWDGRVHPICSVASDLGCQLVGASKDSLLMLRTKPGAAAKGSSAGTWEVVPRPCNMLQPLVIGWSTLGMMPNTTVGKAAAHSCRSALSGLLQHMDTSDATPGLVWAILGTCAQDLAFALLQEQPDLITSSHDQSSGGGAYLAAAAAAGVWTAVQAALQQEHEYRPDYPAPPVPGSALHAKLVAAAAGAVAQGQAAAAVSMLGMAGEWKLAMVVAVSSGDTATAHKAALQATTSQQADAQRLSAALRNMYGASVATVSDAAVKVVGGDGVDLSPAPGTGWKLGSHTSVLTAHAEMSGTEGVRQEEGDVIGPVSDEHPLVAALALDSATRKAIHARTTLAPREARAKKIAADTSKGPRHSFSGLDTESLGSARSSHAVSPSPPPLAMGYGLPTGNPLDDIFGWDGAQDRTSRGSTPTPGGDASAWDSDSDLSTTSANQTAAWKGKVTIRDKTEPLTMSNNADQLRDAMKSLRLVPPPPGAAAAGTGLGMAVAGGPPTLQPPPTDSSGSLNLAPIAPLGAGLGPGAAAFMGQQQQQYQPAPPANNTFSFPDDDPFPDLFPVAPKPSQPAPPQPSAVSNSTAFQGVSPALAAGMASNASSAAVTTPQQSVGKPNPSFQGLSPALAAGMVQPKQAQLSGAFSGLSPALAAGMSGQVQPSSQPITPAPSVPVASQQAQQRLAQQAQQMDPSMADRFYFEGVGMLESGQWAAAEERFILALLLLARQPHSDLRTSKLSFCSQYLAIVQLLAVASLGVGAKEARLYRYAASLPVDVKHRKALVMESVNRNRNLGNNKYCGDTLTALIPLVLGVESDAFLQNIQSDIQDLERLGNRDAAITKDEDLETWPTLVAASTTPQEVADLVKPLF